MQLVLMIVVCLAFLPYAPADPWLDPLSSAVLTWLSVGLVGVSAKTFSWYFDWQLRSRPARRSRLVRWYGWVRFFHTVLIVALYVAILFVLGWGGVVRKTLGLENTILLDELLTFAPFVAALSLEWLGFYRIERTLVETSSHPPKEPFWGRTAYLWYQLRFNLGLALAPFLIFTGARDTLSAVMPWAKDETWFLLATIGLLLFTLLILMPWLLKFLWGMTRLPDGPLRTRLEAAARRLRFRYTDILLWNTHGGVANAMVTGVFRFSRYVLLSDGLVQGMKPDEVEAVFGHEIGHVKHHHMALYLSFMLLSLALVGLGAKAVLPEPLPTSDDDYLALLNDWRHHTDFWTNYVAGMAATGGYVWLVFGFLSRRCERQADVYGCKAVSCPEPTCAGHDEGEPGGEGLARQPTLCRTGINTFIRALDRVAELNGIPRHKPSWRHSSIARRVAFLERVLLEPAVEPRFQRRLLCGKIALMTALVAGVVLLTAWVGLGAAASTVNEPPKHGADLEAKHGTDWQSVLR